MTSEAGQQAKIDNNAGWKNIMLHGKMHLMQIQQAMATAQPTDEGAKSGRHNNEAPITENNSAPTIQ